MTDRPPVRERYFHGDLYDENRNSDKRGLRVIINTHVRTDTGRSSAAVDVQQFNWELKAESSVTTHGLDAKQLRDLGMLFIEAANSMKYDAAEASRRTSSDMMKLFVSQVSREE